MSDHSTQRRLLVGAEEAAAMMGCGRSTFWKRVREGHYPAPVKDGMPFRWKAADLDACLRNPPNVVRLPNRPRSVALGPGTHHLYRHYDKAGQLLYVGVSLSAVARLADHKKESHWFWQIARIEVTAYRTRAAALKAEMISIKKERPMHNIVHAEKAA